MAALTFDALLKGLKRTGGSALQPAYYLHGDDSVLKEEAIRALLQQAIDPAARDFNLDQRAAADLDPESLHALVDTPPMLAARRAVVLRGVEQLKKKSRTREALLDYLKRPNPTTLLVLVQSDREAPESDLTGATVAVTIDRLAPDRVPGWIGHYAGTLGLTIATDAATLLIEAVGTDLGELARELEKLAAAAGGRTATAEDVAQLVGVRHGETIGDLVAAALGRDGPAAARLVEPVLSGLSGVRIVSALGTALVGTALTRSELDRGTPRGRVADSVFRQLMAARPFGVGSYKEAAARWLEWAGLWRAEELDAALRHALAADVALKSGGSDEAAIVTGLVLGFGARRQEAA